MISIPTFSSPPTIQRQTQSPPNLVTYSAGNQPPISQWSFSDNVLPEASIFELAIRSGGSVVSSAVEKGSFAAYNKTEEPLEITAVLSFSGTDAFLQSVLDTLKDLKSGVQRFSIETPTYEYEGMSLESYDYSRTRENGLGVLYISAVFREIREVELAYAKIDIPADQTADPSAASTENGGLQQGEDVPPEKKKSLLVMAGMKPAKTKAGK